MAQPPLLPFPRPIGDLFDGDSPRILPRNRNPYDINSKIMLTAIVSLSFVIVVVVALHLYARCVFRRQARRRMLIRSLGRTDGHVSSSEQPRTGLDPVVIASLPVFVHHNKKGQEDNGTSIECAVCLSMLEDQEMARFLPNCKHTFHAECIDRWLSSRSTCPICRTEAEPRIQPEPREGLVGGAPAALSLEHLGLCMEGTSDGGIQPSPKVSGPNSRLSSFRRMLSRERSSRRIQTEIQQEYLEDLERQ
ncbi:hypothetical protein K2173_001771 [Erythroxylum novogranatense]|uniref:RING-type E3 ubiquitin transferase n=1 Tax=Erythroxylum novogranatense TaxID=1862640 RepID=A0AAV8SIJ7_9ROSI|nr:hypothetical protein K2173_001771 [Erythroxylum novogranatense]